MSAVRLTLLYCDHPDCKHASPLFTNPSPEENAREQRILAKMHGWHFKDGKDYCPEHKP